MIAGNTKVSSVGDFIRGGTGYPDIIGLPTEILEEMKRQREGPEFRELHQSEVLETTEDEGGHNRSRRILEDTEADSGLSGVDEAMDDHVPDEEVDSSFSMRQDGSPSAVTHSPPRKSATEVPHGAESSNQAITSTKTVHTVESSVTGSKRARTIEPSEDTPSPKRQAVSSDATTATVFATSAPSQAVPETPQSLGVSSESDASTTNEQRTHQNRPKLRLVLTDKARRTNPQRIPTSHVQIAPAANRSVPKNIPGVARSTVPSKTESDTLDLVRDLSHLFCMLIQNPRISAQNMTPEMEQRLISIARTVQREPGMLFEKIVQDLHAADATKTRLSNLLRGLITRHNFHAENNFPPMPEYRDLDRSWRAMRRGVNDALGPENDTPLPKAAAAGYLAARVDDLMQREKIDDLRTFAEELSPHLTSPHSVETLISAALCRSVFALPDRIFKGIYSEKELKLYEAQLLSGTLTFQTTERQILTVYQTDQKRYSFLTRSAPSYSSKTPTSRNTTSIFGPRRF